MTSLHRMRERIERIEQFLRLDDSSIVAMVLRRLSDKEMDLVIEGIKVNRERDLNAASEEQVDALLHFQELLNATSLERRGRPFFKSAHSGAAETPAAGAR